MMSVFRSRYYMRLLSIVFNRYSIFLFGIYLYGLIIEYRGGIGVTSFFSHWIELFILIYFYIYFYFILKPGRWRSLLAALPVFIGYVVQDIYYLVYAKVFRLISVLELPELLQVIPFGYGVFITVFIVIPLIIFLWVIEYRKFHTILLGGLPICVLTGLIVFSPNVYTDFIQSKGNGIVKYSDVKSVESNGRYTMLFYKEAERQNALAKTGQYRNRIQYEHAVDLKAKKLKQTTRQRNIHLIVLESFLDPRLFKRARFSKNPVHDDFKKLFGKQLGLSVSPVFGGGTAQAEFEVLCGVPAMERLSSVEFNVFTGSPVYCLPGLLNKVGYRTIATNAYKPNFFNALPAYKGVGFSEIYFPQEYSGILNTYYSTGDVAYEGYMTDSHLLQQNLTYVKKILSEKKTTPLFNYVMTIYGHTPHILDNEKHPEVIQVQSDYADDHFQRATNQFYYRSKAIAKYVNELLAIDRDSLIILVSDHVPPLRNGPNTYKKLHYMNNIKNAYYYNRLMIIEHGKPVIYKPMRHFDLPEVVFNYMTNGNYCREQSCAFLDGMQNKSRKTFLGKYYSIMAHASE